MGEQSDPDRRDVAGGGEPPAVEARGPVRCALCGRCRPAGSAAGAAGCCDGRARLPWHPAAVQVERPRLDVPSARPLPAGIARPAEDGRLWPGGKRAGWNRGHDLATGAPLNRPARDSEIRRRLAAGDSVRAVALALRCGLATVQRARMAKAMMGARRPLLGAVPKSGK